MNNPKGSKKLSDRDSFMMAFGIYGALGFQLVASLLVGVFGGQWLDKKFGTQPWLMMLGLFLGVGAGFYNLFRVVLWKDRESKKRQ